MTEREEREKEEKKMPFIVANYVLPAAKGSARTPLGTKFNGLMTYSLDLGLMDL